MKFLNRNEKQVFGISKVTEKSVFWVSVDLHCIPSEEEVK